MKYFSKTLIVLAAMLAGTAALAQNMVHLNRFSEENAAIEKPADGKPVKGRVVFIGDSITEGWGNQDRITSFPANTLKEVSAARLPPRCCSASGLMPLRSVLPSL